jgi:hypothetical protein
MAPQASVGKILVCQLEDPTLRSHRMLKVGQEVMIRGDSRLFSVRGPSKYSEGKPVEFSLMGIDGRGFLVRPLSEIVLPSTQQISEAREKMAGALAAAACLEKERKQRAFREVIGRHRAFLIERGIVPDGSNDSLCSETIARQFRFTVCYRCHSSIDNLELPECNRCRWIICNCGACGCAPESPAITQPSQATDEVFPDFDSAKAALQRTPRGSMRRTAEGSWIVSGST